MQAWQFALSQGELHGLTNNGKGPVMLGLHGFLDNAESLACLFPYFDNYQFIAIDLPGHGKSYHRPLGAHYHQLDFIQDIHELIEANNWQDIILIGHSLGGILATIYAGVFPERVAKVVSIDACGPLTMEADTSASQVRESVLSRLPKQSSSSGSRPVDIDAAVAARCKISDINAEHARAIIMRNIKCNDEGEFVWGSDPRLRTKSTLRLTESQAQNLMEAIRCPVWFGGATDSFKHLETIYPKRKIWWKNSQIELFSGGHHFHMINPSAVSTAIRSFVEEM